MGKPADHQSAVDLRQEGVSEGGRPFGSDRKALEPVAVLPDLPPPEHRCDGRRRPHDRHQARGADVSADGPVKAGDVSDQKAGEPAWPNQRFHMASMFCVRPVTVAVAPSGRGLAEPVPRYNGTLREGPVHGPDNLRDRCAHSELVIRIKKRQRPELPADVGPRETKALHRRAIQTHERKY